MADRHRRTVVRIAAGVVAGATLLAMAPAAYGAPRESGRAGTAGAADGSDGVREDAAGLQRALDAFTAGGMATAALAQVRDGGRVTWRGTSGVSDLATGAPVRADGRFRIGSTTKPFVATVVLQLRAEGRLALDDPIERHLPGLVPGGDAITVRRLLNHTSGLFDFIEDPAIRLDDPDWLARTRWTVFRPEQLVALATAHPPYFPPGGGWHYSNTNYILAGMLIEKITGHPWGEEVERRIVRPLGLRGTSMPAGLPLLTGPHAHGYYRTPGGPVDVTRINPSMAGAAGAGVSTTDDLARFDAALLGGQLLGPVELAEMKTTVGLEGGFDYGLGLMRFTLPCGEFWGHDGGIPGYSTLLLGDAGGRRQVAFSVNPYDLSDPEAATRAEDAFVLKAACRADLPPAPTGTPAVAAAVDGGAADGTAVGAAAAGPGS